MSCKNVLKPAKLKMPILKEGKEVREVEAMQDEEEQVEAATDHAYAKEANSKRKDAGSAPTTPLKAPVGKKSKGINEMEEEVSNSTISRAIQSMAKDIEELKEHASQTSCMLAALSKSVQFNSEEVQECKRRVKDLEVQQKVLKEENTTLKEKVKEQERYRMRWCLKMKGIPEKIGEDIRAVAIQLFQKIAPEVDQRQMEDAVDIVHRIGKKEDNRSRPVVVLFARRSIKEEIWRKSKNALVCKERGVCFTEMSSSEDREARNKLWPQIEKARSEGKKAYFRGPHGYIEGKKIG